MRTEPKGWKQRLMHALRAIEGQTSGRGQSARRRRRMAAEQVNDPRFNREYALQLVAEAAEELAIDWLNHGNTPDRRQEIHRLEKLLVKVGYWPEHEEFSWCEQHQTYESPIDDRTAHYIEGQAEFMRWKRQQEAQA